METLNPMLLLIAGISLLVTLAATGGALRLLSRPRRSTSPKTLHPISVLKPLKGLDEGGQVLVQPLIQALERLG